MEVLKTFRGPYPGTEVLPISHRDCEVTEGGRREGLPAASEAPERREGQGCEWGQGWAREGLCPGRRASPWPPKGSGSLGAWFPGSPGKAPVLKGGVRPAPQPEDRRV